MKYKSVSSGWSSSWVNSGRTDMASPLRSIGQVLAILKLEFPDVSISKIRFLESEGLLAPERAPSGYRRYAEHDIERLRYILRMQRDHYLPLKVIREHLEMMDRGDEPPKVDTPLPVAGASGMTAAPPSASMASATPAEHLNPLPTKLTRRELLQKSGIAEATLIELERQRMVLPRRGTMYYGKEALTVCVVARRLSNYGMDTRHLRAIKQSAEREAGLVEQAIQPYLRRNAHAAEAMQEVSQLVAHAHAAMMHTLLMR